MKIKYEEGPDAITMGIAGQFKKGEAREVDDKVADALLKKESIKFSVIPAKAGIQENKRRDK